MAASAVIAATLFGLEPSVNFAQTPSPRVSIDGDFRTQLQTLAAKCDELGLADQAKQTRACWIERDPRRQYLFLPSAVPDKKPPAIGSDLDVNWRAKLVELRRMYASRLFELAQQQSASGSATVAYQLLHEVQYHDPTHGGARRVLGAPVENSRLRPRQPQVAHAKYGWQRGKWLQIESPHFQIATDAGQQAGMELATRLEEFHAVWRQLFFEYWSTPAWLADRFSSTASPAPAERKHQVVFFRDRDEYVRQLSATEPKIAVTHGYYLKANSTSYFYAGDENAWSIWYHEAAHQLFQETGEPIRDVGEKWNFWVVEGIAVYLESTVKQDGFFTVGGFDADRLQALRLRVMEDEQSMPLDELFELGREALQRHPDIRRLYSQAAGLTHFLLDYRHGHNRDKFVRKLTETYAGRDTPRTFLAFPELDGRGFEQELRDFLTVTADDLPFLGPASLRRNLSLARAKIDDESLKYLAGSAQLEWLDLAFTPITEIGIENLGPLPRLKRLTLVNTKVTDGVAEKLAPPALPCLEELDLSGTAITDEVLRHLSARKQLKVLRLSHTRITDAGLEHLAGLRELEELDVDQTQISPAALTRLKTQLPKLK